MKASENAVNLIKRFEGCRRSPYRDAGGLWTIGYGHLIGDGKSLPANINRDFTEEEINALLIEDIARFERGLNMCLVVPLTQNQFDACISWVFNLGIAEFKKYIAPMINGDDDPEEVVAEMIKFDHVGTKELTGLKARREAEKELYLKD